jgi:prepilin-type N-terminal cleavage/methylation domain-containing protein
MNLIPVNRPKQRTKAARGMTLVEIMVAVGVGSLLLATLAVVFVSSTRNFVAMGNYVSMDSSSRNALDRMTREIRRAGDLTYFSPTRMVFAQRDGSGSLVYEWNEDTHQLTEWKSGDSAASVLLRECDRLLFTLKTSTFASTTDAADGKAIAVEWRCSRTILGKKTNTEDMEQALIVIRNK